MYVHLSDLTDYVTLDNILLICIYIGGKTGMKTYKISIYDSSKQIML